jgi:hypothetical protein
MICHEQGFERQGFEFLNFPQIEYNAQQQKGENKCERGKKWRKGASKRERRKKENLDFRKF